MGESQMNLTKISNHSSIRHSDIHKLEESKAIRDISNHNSLTINHDQSLIVFRSASHSDKLGASTTASSN